MTLGVTEKESDQKPKIYFFRRDDLVFEKTAGKGKKSSNWHLLLFVSQFAAPGDLW